MGSIFNLFKKSRKATLVNKVLTVTLNDKEKTVLIFHDADEKLYKVVIDKDYKDSDILTMYNRFISDQKLFKPETGISKIIKIKEEKKKEEILVQEEAKVEIAIAKELQNKYPTLLATGDFIENDQSVYLKTIPNLSLPILLIKRFIILVQGINSNNANALDEYCALKYFWMWCSLNPNPESRENLFRFIQNNKLKITKYGFFASYRRVVSKGVTNEEVFEEEDEVVLEQTKELAKYSKNLSEFVSASFLKIKTQKKSPKKFLIGSNEAGEMKIFKLEQDLGEYDNVGNLNDLYLSLSADNGTAVVTTKTKEVKIIPVQTYTDAHTHTMDIRIGREVSMPPEDCNWNNHESCSRGLHIASKDGHGCGDTLLIALVNPMKVVSVPYDDGSKARCWAYFPVAVASKFGSLDDIDTLELGDEYYKNSIKELNELLKNNTPTELKKHRLLNDLSPEAMKIATKQLCSIQDTLKSRVVNQ